MADNTSLGAAKTAKNDKLYTQYSDIESEINAYVERMARGKIVPFGAERGKEER